MQTKSESELLNDDRDLLFIEEEVQNRVPDLHRDALETAQVHPYKQLFSKLRG